MASPCPSNFAQSRINDLAAVLEAYDQRPSRSYSSVAGFSYAEGPCGDTPRRDSTVVLLGSSRIGVSLLFAVHQRRR